MAERDFPRPRIGTSTTQYCLMRNGRFFAGQLLSTTSRSSIRPSCSHHSLPPNLLQSCPQFSSARHQCNGSIPVPRNSLKRTISRKEAVHSCSKPNIPFYGQVRFASTIPKTDKSTRRFRTQWLVGGILLTLVAGSTFGLGRYKSEPKLFDPPRFTPFTIVKREVVSPTSIILTLRPRLAPLSESTADLYKEWWERGIWSVEVKQPELQIARSYTPLPPTQPDENRDLRFLIRKEHKGEVSGYLHSLAVGSKIELRGPHPGFDLPQDVAEVLFLAGGTGIAPALQVAYTLLERRNPAVDRTRIRIVWSNRRREDCQGGGRTENKAPEMQKQNGQIVQELEGLQQRHPGQVTVDYLVDEENTFLDQRKILRFTTESEKTQTRQKFLFVSGPEGFVNYFAGPKKWEDGKEVQGEITGVLGRLRLVHWTIWKL